MDCQGSPSNIFDLWLVESMNTEPMDIYIYGEREREREREVYFKELVHVIVKADKSKICCMGQQAGDRGKSCSLSPKAICWQN